MSLLRHRARIAAFFDLDGTLLPPPSLEMRFIRLLRYRRAIGAVQILGWVAEAIRLAPSGLFALRHGNKMYLRGVRCDAEAIFAASFFRSAGAHLRNGELRPAAPFFPAALNCLAWHGAQGHAVVLVSGTIEPLAHVAARALEAEIRRRGCEAAVRVCATRAEEVGGRWTGRRFGEPMAGAEKARAARRLAESEGLDLWRCHGYGNSSDDRSLLATVGRPCAINPSWRLARMARRAGWPILYWKEEATRRSAPFAFAPGGPGRGDTARERQARTQWKTGEAARKG